MNIFGHVDYVTKNLNAEVSQETTYAIIMTLQGAIQFVWSRVQQRHKHHQVEDQRQQVHRSHSHHHRVHMEMHHLEQEILFQHIAV